MRRELTRPELRRRDAHARARSAARAVGVVSGSSFPARDYVHLPRPLPAWAKYEAAWPEVAKAKGHLSDDGFSISGVYRVIVARKPVA